MSKAQQHRPQLALEIAAQPEWLGMVRQFISLISTNLGLNMEDSVQLEMSVDEACANSIEGMQSLKLPEHSCRVRIEVDIDEESVSITITDQGHDFTEHFHKARPLHHETDRTRRRGYGLQIIKTFMDDVHYEHDGNKGNRLRLIKYLPRERVKSMMERS